MHSGAICGERALVFRQFFLLSVDLLKPLLAPEIELPRLIGVDLGFRVTFCPGPMFGASTVLRVRSLAPGALLLRVDRGRCAGTIGLCANSLECRHKDARGHS